MALLLLTPLFFVNHRRSVIYVSAETCEGDVNQRINCYQEELTKLTNQSKTLSNQIAQFDAQIKLTTLKISQTEEKITQLGGRINLLEGSLDSLSKAFSERASETYRMARAMDSFLVVILSEDLQDAYSKYHYLQKIQESDRNLLERLQSAQTTYQTQKTEQEKLQEELQKQKTNLNNQKKAKSDLLKQTNSDEKKYQQLLAQAFAEKAAIEKALISGVKVGPVKRGDPIALVGNTGYPGCSSGKHLHFEIRKDNNWVDPASYLQSKSVKDEQNGNGQNMVSLGSGSWPWPIQDTIRLTQFFGRTPFSWQYKYSGEVHTGLDMVSTGSDVIKAPADGDLFKSSQACGSSIINIVYIDHGDGIISFYLHVQ